jgi:multicomponent Na+:H+ antiporter subunit D
MTQATLMNLLPALIVALPLVGGVLALPLRRLGEHRRIAVLATLCAGALIGVLALVPGALRGELRAISLVHFAPQVELYLRVDAMGVLFAATVALLFLLALVYSAGYLRRDGRESRYFAFFMLAQGWMLGVAFAGNLITLLVFYELFSILVYPLVVHEETPEAIRAGTKYIIYILVGGSLILLGVIFSFYLAGERPFTPGGILDPTTDRTILMVTFWCLVTGFGVKAALMPLHGWVPDVHPAAPASFSALLSGVMVATGCFGILRVVFEVFGVELAAALGVMPVLTGVAAVSVLLAAILAAGEDDLKRRLAWSTISQMAYVVLAVSLLAPKVTAGALVHISNHAFLKGALFFCAGLLASQAGIRRVSEMAGVARRMPLTMAVFTLAALGIVGVPPLSGFISKWVLGVGILEAEHPLVLLVLLGGALLAALYLLQPVWMAYFNDPDMPEMQERTRRRPEAPLSMLVSLLAAAAISLMLGFAAAMPGLPLSLAERAVAVFFGPS